MKIRRVHVLVVIWAGIPFAFIVTGFFAHNPRRHGELVSGEQIRAIRRIHRAVQAYERTHGQRPERLEALVAEKLIDAKTAETRHNPRVLYVSTLRKTDPPSLVLLCTPPVGRRADMCHVIYNDGRYKQVTSRELTALVQKTYTYLGEQLRQPPATQKATSQSVGV